MKGKDNRHVIGFRGSKLKPGESIKAHLEGWIGEMMGSGRDTQRNGQFILTNERACFYRKGFVGEVFETIPLSKITSVETLSRLGYRVLRLHTSHDDLAFKSFESKEVFDAAYESLEALRHAPVNVHTAPAEGPSELLSKLGKLREAGVLTEEEFKAKKAEILARI
jgi:hypothetical protein